MTPTERGSSPQLCKLASVELRFTLGEELDGYIVLAPTFQTLRGIRRFSQGRGITLILFVISGFLLEHAGSSPHSQLFLGLRGPHTQQHSFPGCLLPEMHTRKLGCECTNRSVSWQPKKTGDSLAIISSLLGDIYTAFRVPLRALLARTHSACT